MDKFSSIGNQEPEAIEDLYQTYLKNPESLDKSWQQFFLGYELARKKFPVKHDEVIPEHLDMATGKGGICLQRPIL